MNSRVLCGQAVGLLIGLLVADIYFLYTGTITLDIASFQAPVFVSIIMLAGAALFARVGRYPLLPPMLIALAYMILFSLLMGLFNHLAMVPGKPLIDPVLVQMDQAIGFDWPEFVTMMAGYPWLMDLTNIAYQSSGPQIVLIIIVLSLNSQKEQVQRLVLAITLTATATVGFWLVFPSLGTSVYFNQQTMALNADLFTGARYGQTLLDFQSGRITTLSRDTMLALIAFPSFHAVLAILCMHATRQLGWVHWLNLIWCLIIVLSIPAQGGHHLIDVIAGIAVALAAIAIGDIVMQRLCARAADVEEALTFEPGRHVKALTKFYLFAPKPVHWTIPNSRKQS